MAWRQSAGILIQATFPKEALDNNARAIWGYFRACCQETAEWLARERYTIPLSVLVHVTCEREETLRIRGKKRYRQLVALCRASWDDLTEGRGKS